MSSLEKLAIKMWFSFNFAKKFKGPSFCGGWIKELETFNKHLSVIKMTLAIATETK